MTEQWVQEFQAQSIDELKRIYCESAVGFADESIYLAREELKRRGVDLAGLWHEYHENKEQAAAIESNFADIREWASEKSGYCDGLGAADVRALLKEYDRLKEQQK